MRGNGSNSLFASLDCARTKVCLEEARSDPKKFHEVLAACFLEGSRGTSETATLFALDFASSSDRAVQVADIIKSLPTAVPTRNAGPLASISAYLALSFEEDECRAPLRSFSYASSEAARSAVTAVIEHLKTKVREEWIGVDVALTRVRDFLSRLLSSGLERERFAAVRGLVIFGSNLKGSARQQVLDFLLSIHISSSPFLAEEVAEGAQINDVHFVLEIAHLVSSVKSMSTLLLRCIMRSLELGCMSSVLALWNFDPEKTEDAIRSIGYDFVLYVMILAAAADACKGQLSSCYRVLQKVNVVIKSMQVRRTALLRIVSSVVSSVCIAIGSLCTAGGANDVARVSAEIVRRLRASEGSAASDVSGGVASVEFAYEEARRLNLPGVVLPIGLLLKLISFWKTPKILKSWLDCEFTDLVKSGGLWFNRHSRLSGVVGSMVQEGISNSDEPGSESLDEGHLAGDVSVSMALASVALALMSHDHAHVRLSAGDILANMRDSRVLLFYLPAVMMRLQKEGNGVVAVKILSELVVCPCLLTREETRSVSLNALMRLFRQPEGHTNAATYQAGLVTLARAVGYAPGVVSSLLLAEVEKLKSSFELTQVPIRTAAAAAVLKFIDFRPARGTNFVPFISLCISSESMEIAPDAAAFCFEAMITMTREEVLDPVKAVKVVLKSFPGVLDVTAEARKSYLRLLGCVSTRSESKKGKLIAEKVIAILRGCLTDLHPFVSGSPSALLTLEEVEQAAESLGRYTPDEILRIAFSQDEPEEDIDAERERIERIEEDCMAFAQNLVSVVAMALKSGKVAEPSHLKILLRNIVRHEWENRKRSSFDPERIIKLKTIAQASRRSRMDSEHTQGKLLLLEEETASGFLLSVEGFPVGVVRGMYERCVKTKGKKSGAVEVDSAVCSISMRVLGDADALSPALSWTSVVEDILRSSETSDYKGSCLFVLRLLRDDSEVQEARARWFGLGSPLFNDEVETSLYEAKELFVGMVQHFPQEAIELLASHRDTLSFETTRQLVRSALGMQKEESFLRTIIIGLLPVLCSPNNGWAEESLRQIERDLFDICLVHCNPSFVHEVLQCGGEFNASMLRLSCLKGDFILIRGWIQSLLHSGMSSEVHGELLATVGNALQALQVAERREIVTDMSSDKEGNTAVGMNQEMKMTLAAYSLGVGALLPNAKAALIAAPKLCSRGERKAVSGLVRAVTHEGREG